DLDQIALVVTGLPRSGTSMMMQMLEAGGLPVLSDSVREPDQDNPKGYFEYEPVRHIGRDNSWLPEAKGRAVKIVVPLLIHLPPAARFQYRVIFMERPLGEILASQKKMLDRRDREGAALPEEKLRDLFARGVRQTKRALSARGIPTLVVEYLECLENPGETAARVNSFLGGGLDEKAMAAAVSQDLYRTRLTD
ncbi:MAG: hypothetical protein AB1896_16565, partial [Thermodesulfobacteriota bacterium]